MPHSAGLSVTEDGGSTPAPPSGVTTTPSGWYALRLHSNREFRVAEILGQRGIEAYIPTYKESVRWSDRSVDAVRRVFPGYLFVRPAPVADLIQIPGVLGALPTNLEPSLIDEREIDNLKLALERGREARPADQCPYVAGEQVTIDSGPLAGVTGLVTRTQGVCRVFVTVKLLNRTVSVEVDAADLKNKGEKS